MQHFCLEKIQGWTKIRCSRAGNIIPSKSINLLAKLVLHLYITPLIYPQTFRYTVPPTSLPVSRDLSAFSIANKMFQLPFRPAVKETDYFVITADEVIKQKKKPAALTIKQKKIKQQKRLERERKSFEISMKKQSD